MPSARASSISLTCGELGAQIQRPLARIIGGIVAGVAILAGLVALYDVPHAGALGWILCGALAPIVAWSKLRRPGLPLICLIALQTLAIFATPIVTQNVTLADYPDDDIFQAGLEIFIFCLSLTAGWRIAFTGDVIPRSIRYYWGLNFIRMENPGTLRRASLVLLGCSAAYQFAFVIGLLNPVFALLPHGAFPVIRTLFDACALAGAIIGGYAIGAGLMPRSQQAAFWLLFAVIFLAKASGVLLSATMPVIAATGVGCFLGARRPPWIFAAIVFSVISFFNLSKFEMRAKYWDEYGYGQGVSLSEFPGYYAEWAGYSMDILTFNRSISVQDEATGQRLTDRLNNLQNLLYAQKAVVHQDVPLLEGQTYSLIPKLLIPRLFWPDKPRSHEGQMLLNVHFGRQRMEDSLVTNVAWGLLAGSYGNFGPVWGAIVCGVFLGSLAGGLERAFRPYPITSLEAFLFLILAVHFGLSFEMAASVWVTSVFQMIVAIVVCVAPFAVRRLVTPEDQPPA